MNLLPNDQNLSMAKILIVDDEAANVRVLEWALNKSNFLNFRSLTDSTRARDEFVNFQPDIVLLDLNMPQLDGFGVMAEFKKVIAQDEFVPVLVLTGENSTDTRRRALEAGASDFLNKPLDYTEVMLRIKNLLQTRYLHRQARDTKAQLDALMKEKKRP